MQLRCRLKAGARTHAVNCFDYRQRRRARSRRQTMHQTSFCGASLSQRRSKHSPGCGQARTCVTDAGERHGRGERASKDASSQQRSPGGQRPYPRPRVGLHCAPHDRQHVLGSTDALLANGCTTRCALIRFPFLLLQILLLFLYFCSCNTATNARTRLGAGKIEGRSHGGG